eukprot:6242943-Alexandrium_andersonii.AAC.1
MGRPARSQTLGACGDDPAQSVAGQRCSTSWIKACIVGGNCVAYMSQLKGASHNWANEGHRNCIARNRTSELSQSAK